jgi:hypothetical protein
LFFPRQRCELKSANVNISAAIKQKDGRLYTVLDIEDYQIRILAIVPGPRDSPLRCLLKTTSLLYPEPYIALSYCWGDPKEKVPILVNGFNFEITLNLSYALLQLREWGKNILSGRMLSASIKEIARNAAFKYDS